MKKIALFIAIFLLVGCGNDRSSTTPVWKNIPTSTKSDQPSSPPESSGTTAESSKTNIDPADEIKDRVEKIIVEVVNSGVEISKIEINKNMGTDKEDDFIALLFLKFTVKNSAKTTKQVLDLYSSDIGLKMQELDGVDDITIFWESPYLQKDVNVIKISFKRNKDGVMEYSELWYSPIFD